MKIFFKKFLLLIVISNFSFLFANTYYSNIFLLEEHLQTRIGSLYLYKDNYKSSVARKDQTFLVFGEYKFFKFYSLYVGIPYTWRWIENSRQRQYLDFIRIINKFEFPWRWLTFYTGVLIDLPRNHNEGGDVPKGIGFVEPYFGLSFFYSSFITKFSIHWNTQTNQKFKEEFNQEFEKKWIINASFGYGIKEWFFWIETQYQKIYDPKSSSEEKVFYGPAVAYKFYGYEISFLYLFYPKNSLYDKKISLQIQKSIDF